MTPAKAAILNTALAPLWQRLRDWVQAALQAHRQARGALTREDAATLRTAVFEIEALLRRLILVAATAVTVDIAGRWSANRPDHTHRRSPARQDAPATTDAASTRKTTFRLYTIRWSKADPALTTTVAVEEGAAPAAHRPYTNSHSDTLTSAPHNARNAASRSKASAARRACIAQQDPEMTVEEFLAWSASRTPTETSAEAAWREMQEQLAIIERAGNTPPRDADAPARPRLERKAAPDLIDATALQARLALAAQIAANPEAMIQRAARAMARCREVAYRLSLKAAPRLRGALAASVAMFATVIPFHTAFKEALGYFALSYTEPDTT